MKFRFFLFVCICLNDPSRGQVSLEVKIENLKSGTAYLWNTNSTTVDTVKIQDGSFRINYDLSEPTLFYLKIDHFNEFDLPIRLILSSEKTLLTFHSLRPAIRGSKWKDLYPNQPEYEIDPNKNRLLHQFEKDWLTFSDSVMSLTGTTLEDTTLLDKRKRLYDAYIERTEKNLLANSDKIASAVTLHELLISNHLVDIQRARQLYDQLHDEVRYSLIGLKVGRHINRQMSLQTGSEAPNFEFLDINGKRFTHRDFEGQKLLLHFWASTCGPCRVENRELLQFALTNKDVVIVNISLDNNKSQWLKAIETDGLGAMLNVCDLKGTNSKMAEMFYIHGIPAYYLIDEHGIILVNGSLKEIRKRLN